MNLVTAIIVSNGKSMEGDCREKVFSGLKIKKPSFLLAELLYKERMLNSTKTQKVGIFFGDEEVVKTERASIQGYNEMEVLFGELENTPFESSDDAPLNILLRVCRELQKQRKPSAKSPTNIFLISTMEGKGSLEKHQLEELTSLLSSLYATVVWVYFDTTDQKTQKPTKEAETNVSQIIDLYNSGAPIEYLASETGFQRYSFYGKRNTNSTKKYTGMWLLTPDFQISVTAYYTSALNSFPPLKKSALILNKDTHEDKKPEVKMERTYWDEEANKEVKKEEIIKGYMYGRLIVPIPLEIEAIMDVRDEKQLRLLCFCDLKDIKRHYLTEKMDMFLPNGHDTHHLAFNALCTAMIESKKAAVCRFVYRDNYRPQLYCLFGSVDEATGHHVMYGTQLPTAEDIRQQTFRKLPTSNADQREAIEAWMSSPELQLEDDEAEPHQFFDPTIHLLKENLFSRLLNKDSEIIQALPQFHHNLIYLEKNHSMSEELKEPLEEIKRQFNGLKVHEMKQKVSKEKHFWGEELKKLKEQQVAVEKVQAEHAKEPAKMDAENDALRAHYDEGGYAHSVSRTKPISDFWDMVDNKKIDLVAKAMKEMGLVIEKLAIESVHGSFYKKGIECIEALRKAAVREDEFQKFNDFIRSLKDKQTIPRDFWQLVVSHGISLITNIENALSTVTEADASKFLLEEEKIGKAQPARPSLGDGSGTLDDIE
jgi:non-homologous end joining protein Ku